ncbi:hypothetical protein AB0E56_15995 [Microbacterium sp. NPDC028030]|uniref:hypothetical protein n=1 Tax=Microbacterium sp. NPDC028030 TaxID=3155124 RepID=UPI0033F87224
MTEHSQHSTGFSRRTIMKGAAWSVPVVAAVVATPLAAASITPTSVAWTGTSTSLAALQLLDGGGTLTAQALVTLPTEFSIRNGSGARRAEIATISVTVGRPAGINIPVGRARGFGVQSVNGVTTTAGERTAAYQTAPIVGQFGFPLTTWTGTRTITIASDGTLVMPIAFGLAGVSTGVAVSALASFPVTLNVTLGTDTYTAVSSVTVPVGAGIL